MLASGICHTDRLVAAGRDWWPAYPYVLGHEGVGEIESVGAGVSERRVGERVLLAWKAPCGSCRFCLRGDAQLCADALAVADGLVDADGTTVAPSLRVGSHASMALVPAPAAVPLPADLEPSIACLIGCAGLTGYGAVRHTAAVAPGTRVAVIGCGAVGLAVIMAAREAGASTLVAFDPLPERRVLALRAGATEALDPADPATDAALLELTGGHGMDHAFDAVGSAATTMAGLDCLDTGGTCTLIGTPAVGETMVLDLESLYLKRSTLKVSQYGDVMPDHDAPAVAALHQAGRIDLGLLRGREIVLEDAPRVLREGSAGPVRSVIVFD